MQGEGFGLGKKGTFVTLGIISQANPSKQTSPSAEPCLLGIRHVCAKRTKRSADNGSQAGYGVQACFGVPSLIGLWSRGVRANSALSSPPRRTIGIPERGPVAKESGAPQLYGALEGFR